MINECFVRNEVEDIQIAIKGFPRRERDKGGAKGNANLPQQIDDSKDIGARMSFLQVSKYGVVERLNGGNDEDTTAVAGAQVGWSGASGGAQFWLCNRRSGLEMPRARLEQSEARV